MYRSTKKKAVKRGSLSAVVVLGALATGVGIAGASTHTSEKAPSSGVAPTIGAAKSFHDDLAGPGNDVRGLVTAVTPTSITVQGRAGTAATNYAIDSSTTVSKERSAATVADVTVGEHVRITPTASSATTAASIKIDLAHVGGKVVSVSGDSIVVSTRGGINRTIVVSASTTYTKAGASSSLSSVTVGSLVFAEGLEDSSHALIASAVGIGQPATAGSFNSLPPAGSPKPMGSGGASGGRDGGRW